MAAREYVCNKSQHRCNTVANCSDRDDASAHFRVLPSSILLNTVQATGSPFNHAYPQVHARPASRFAWSRAPYSQPPRNSTSKRRTLGYANTKSIILCCSISSHSRLKHVQFSNRMPLPNRVLNSSVSPNLAQKLNWFNSNFDPNPIQKVTTTGIRK